jgi:hypothetical protein
MPDKFRSLTLRQAIALHIFYSSPDEENLVGQTLNSNQWGDPTGIVTAITFRKTGTTKDEALEKLVAARDYKKILEKYGKSTATFKMVVIYKHNEGKSKEMNLTKAIEEALAPEELPDEIMRFLLEKKEYSFLRG